MQIELPHWGTLDRSCSWQAFAKGCRQPTIVQRIVDFRPDAVLGVDWSALPAFEALHASLVAEDMQLPYVYMNYRCLTPPGFPPLSCMLEACKSLLNDNRFKE